MLNSQPRRAVPRAVREELFLRSGGTCEHEACDEVITVDSFHAAHLRAHVHGGAEVVENLAAWCARCNLRLGAVDVADTRAQPRAWQLEAINVVIRQIAETQAATVSAAPGAGKTIFTGLVFEALYDLGLVDRLVVLTPRLTLVEQWAHALRHGRHIELKPGSEIERPGQFGTVNTYQSLNAETLSVHETMAARARTMVALDEVHHVGEGEHRGAWARNVAQLAGDVDIEVRVAAVLNLSGTLWRSDASERISTVRYRPIEHNRLEAQVDVDVPAERLILEGQLRPIDLYRIDGRVEMFDVGRFEGISSNLADLDERQTRATLRELAAHQPWRRAFVQAVLARLQVQHEALERHPVKALIVSASQADAATFRDEVNEQMREMRLTPFAELAVSDEPAAAATLERFRTSRDVGVLCTVDMAGEGYDCPDVAVVGYASNKLTELYVRQVVARAMRVTEAEQRTGIVIPAAIVVPDVPLLIEKLSEYLSPFAHEVMLEAQQRELAEWEASGEPRMTERPFIVDSIMPGQQRVTVPLRDDTFTFELQAFNEGLAAKFSLPMALMPRAMAMMEELLAERRRARPFELDPGAENLPPVREPLGIEEAAALQAQRLANLEGWWKMNGDTPIAAFAAESNRAGAIASGGRASASKAQLDQALASAERRIVAYCTRTGAKPPRRIIGAVTRDNGESSANTGLFDDQV